MREYYGLQGLLIEELCRQIFVTLDFNFQFFDQKKIGENIPQKLANYSN